MELGTQGWLEDGSANLPSPSICPSCLEHTHPSKTTAATRSWSLPLTQLPLGSILARSSPSPGESSTHSVLFAAMNVNPGVKGFAACPHTGLAAPSPMIYALIWECLFLPGDHMGPCLHIIFVFAFASLPSLLPPQNGFHFY